MNSECLGEKPSTAHPVVTRVYREVCRHGSIKQQQGWMSCVDGRDDGQRENNTRKGKDLLFGTTVITQERQPERLWERYRIS